MSQIVAAATAPKIASGLERRELAVWFAVSLCATSLLKTFAQTQGSGFGFYADGFLISGFTALHVLAWFAVIRLLYLDDRKAKATAFDYSVIIALGLLNLLPAQRVTLTVAALFAAYVFWTADRLSTPRAAATVLWALFVQAIVGPLIFSFFRFDLLRADAALVGLLLDATQMGLFHWHDNIIETTGHSLEVYGPCSSFHNISLAALCWITVTKLHRTNWIATDFLFGAAACAAMIIMNATRLYLMAQNFASYRYWHDETGAQIFALTATGVIVLISLWGALLGNQVRE